MPRRSQSQVSTWWNRQRKQRGRRKSSATPLRVLFEQLEDRRVLAWNLNLIHDQATTNVSSATVANTTTFTATGTGATLNWGDVLTALAQGNHVVVDSGSTGTEAGNITDLSGGQMVPFAHNGLSLTFQSGSGSNLVGNINIAFIAFTGNDVQIVINAHGSVTTGALCKGTFAGPREQLSSVSITAANGSVSTGGPYGGRVEAVNLSVQAATGIGTSNSLFFTKATNFEAQTSTGGIFVDNTGDLKIGGVSDTLHGVRVTQSGNILLQNQGHIELTIPPVDLNDAGELIVGAGNIHLQALGGTSDILLGDDISFPDAAIQSTGGNITLDAGRDLLIGDATTGRVGNIFCAGGINLAAGRHIIVDCGSLVEAGGIGNIMATAGGNISIIDTAGMYTGAWLRTQGGNITLITAPGGAITLQNGVSPAIVTLSDDTVEWGDVTLVTDRLFIQNSIRADQATVTIRTASTNGSVEIHIGGADGASALGLTDGELEQIFAEKIIIGDKTIANTITVSGAIEHSRDADFEVLTARNIVFNSGSSWTTAGGDLAFRANYEGMATTGDFVGIELDGATITATGAGDIVLQGRGGAGDGSTLNYGIRIGNAQSATDSEVTSTNGAIVLSADSIFIDTPGLIDAGTGQVTIQPLATDGSVAINLGGDDELGVLGLTDAELDRITAGSIVIGDATSGAITLSAAIDRSTSTHIELHSGGAIKFDGGSLNTAGGDVLLAPGVGGVDPTTAGVDITGGTVSFASDLAIAIEGQTVDTGHRQLNVAGTVDLAGVDLVLSGAFVPPTGTFYAIVTATNILNQFNGLNDGDIVNINGVDLKIHYTSNSVILERPAVAQQASLAVTDAFGVAGFKIPLHIVANSNDTDGDEIFRVIISGVPEGATFWRGNSPIGKDIGGGMWRFTQAWLENLSIRLPADYEGDVELTVIARSVETTSGDVSEVSAPLVIHLSKTQDLIALGAGAGGEPWVQVIDRTNGNVVAKFLAYNESFTGGVRVALGDLTGDGTPEIVAAQGQGDRNVVRVFDLDGVELKAFRTAAYGVDGFDGVNVALGDVDGDGRHDIVVAPSQGKAEIRVFRNEFIAGEDPFDPSNDPVGTPWRRFLAFPETFTGGAVVAVADIGTAEGLGTDPNQLDGRGEVIVGSGAGMKATVKIFGVQSAKPTLVQTFTAFSSNYLGGIASIDAGRINGDTIPDIVVGAGQGYGSMIRVFEGRTGSILNLFRAYEGESRHAAVNLALVDTDGDQVLDEIITAQGAGGTTRALRTFAPLAGTLVDEVLEGDPDFSGQYWIGA